MHVVGTRKGGNSLRRRTGRNLVMRLVQGIRSGNKCHPIYHSAILKININKCGYIKIKFLNCWSKKYFGEWFGCAINKVITGKFARRNNKML
jgi:hypothetical protein